LCGYRSITKSWGRNLFEPNKTKPSLSPQSQQQGNVITLKTSDTLNLLRDKQFRVTLNCPHPSAEVRDPP